MSECQRTTFSDQVTQIKSVWLNAVDKLLVAVGCATTPAQVIAAIGAATVAQLEAHTKDRNNPHGTTAVQVGAVPLACMDGYCIKVVSSLPAEPDPNIIYFTTG